MVTWSNTSATPSATPAKADQQHDRQEAARGAESGRNPGRDVRRRRRAGGDQARAGDPLDRLDERVRPDLELSHLVEDPLRVGLRAHAREQVLRDETADNGERVELGIELARRQLHLRERLADERQRGRQANAVPARDLGQALHDRAELDLRQRFVSIQRQQLPDLVAKRVEIELLGQLRGEHEQDLGQERDVFLPEGEQEQQHALSDVVRYLPDHPEVEEVDRPVRPEHVPRVRVGVEEAVGQDLAVERLEELGGGLLALGAERRLAHRAARDQLEDEEPPRRELVVNRGRVETRKRLQHLPHPFDVRGFLLEVELTLKRHGQVLDDGGQIDDPPKRFPALRLSGEQAQEPEVAHDLVARSGPLNLDDHAFPALERRLVPLADRPRRERDRIDRLEHVFPRDAELFLHHLDDLGLGQRGDIVLQRGELDDELVRQEIGPRRKNLAELRERRAELLERVPQAAGTDLGRVAAASGLAKPVLREDGRDPARAGEETAFDLGLCHRLPSSRWVWTITTVHGALCETRFGTFSSRNSLRPLMPTLPTTITSTFSSFAVSIITRAGSFPCAASARASVPTTSATYSASSLCVVALSMPSRTDWQTISSAS